MACLDWSAQVCLNQLHGGRPHQVCHGLGHWRAKEDDKEDIAVITGRHRGSMQDFCCLQPRAVRRHEDGQVIGLYVHDFAVSAEASSIMVLRKFSHSAAEALPW